MSNGPTRGDKISLRIPPDSIVYYSGMAQSSLNQVVQLKDSNEKEMFTMEGASSPIKGGSTTPKELKGGSFTATGPGEEYFLSIGTKSGTGTKWSQVLWDANEIGLDNEVYLKSYTFISEDSTDPKALDYNDCYVSLHWFRTVG